MRRRLFTFASALSLLLCAAVAVLWVRSYRTGVKVAFRWADTRWQAGADRGRAWLDDAPQRAWEAEALRQQYRRDQEAENAREKREREAYKASLAAPRPSARPEDFPPGTPEWVWRKAVVVGGDEERRRFERQLDMAEQSNQRRRALYAAHMSATAAVPRPVRRSASLAWPAGAAAVPPALWLGGFVRRRHKVGRLRREGRCVHCGYDLRASPERCPECGTRGEVKR